MTSLATIDLPIETSSGDDSQLPKQPAERLRHTKIVATIGPATESTESIEQLLKSGVSVFRLNFSHGNYESHKNVMQHIRNLSDELHLPAAILQDLCGPKIRISNLGSKQQVELDQVLILTTSSHIQSAKESGSELQFDLATNYESILTDIKKGDSILIDDGHIELQIERVEANRAFAKVTRAGRLQTGKGINLPGVSLSTPSITKKDWQDLEWGVEQGVDWVALSFVRQPEDVRQIKDYLQSQGSLARVIAKIERPEAIEQIDEIIEQSDGIMVARGDLGLETDLAGVPLLQKQLIDKCRIAGRPVITATQMLDSMVTSSIPTRAEVSDVANAVFDASDAVMLSNETAVGEFPYQAVEFLHRIASNVESSENHLENILWGKDKSDVNAITAAAAETAIHSDAKYLLVFTESGETARKLSRFRLPIPILAVTNRRSTVPSLCLSYGVHPIYLPEISTLVQLLDKMDDLVPEQGWGVAGDTLVVVSSLNNLDGKIDTIHLHHV